MPPRYDPYANGGKGGYVADPLDEAKAALGRADRLSAETGLDQPYEAPPVPPRVLAQHDPILFAEFISEREQ